MDTQARKWVAGLLMGAQVASGVALMEGVLPLPVGAVLSAPNAKIARTGEVALRRAIPAFNPDVKAVQSSCEVRRASPSVASLA